MTPDPGAARTRLLRVLGLSALADLVIGAGLFLFGRQAESDGLMLAAACLGLAGLLVGGWVVVARDRPERR